MRRYLGIMITAVIVLLVLLGLNAVSLLRLDRPPESEEAPNRSSYNTGATGTRAFYQLLEESGYQVARWRNDYGELHTDARDAALVMIGPPAAAGGFVSGKEAGQLKSWVRSGGRLLIISRRPQIEFSDWTIAAQVDPTAVTEVAADPALDRVIDKNSDALIAQPTELTRNVRGLAVSRLAARLKFNLKVVALPTPSPVSSPAGPAPTRDSRREAEKAEGDTHPADKDQSAGASEDKDENSGDDKEEESEEPASPDRESSDKPDLSAPVVHLGDSSGAVLADFDYGKGRVIFLSDPFVVANNGIGQGANLTLALNLVNALGGHDRKIFFDEALHGYEDVSNPLLTYFRGTPVLWVFGQGVLIALLIAYSFGRRFARPLPLPQVDRHSPLEFVGSMANLQQVAHARDLALENIYPRFKARLCRTLGLSVKAGPEEVAASLHRRRLKVSPGEVRRTMIESERALAGGEIDDHKLTSLVATMRRITTQLK